MTVYNYLGVLIDNASNFQQFVDDMYNNVKFRVYQLKQIRPYITSDIACQICKQTILLLMDYCNFMIESGPITRVKQFENLSIQGVEIHSLF